MRVRSGIGPSPIPQRCARPADGRRDVAALDPQWAPLSQQKAMTCGYAVNEAVDNSAYTWITSVILWITKKISIAPLGCLRRVETEE
jgi:hypothetical protein